MFDLALPCYFESDASLAAQTYYGIGGTARFLAFPASLSEFSNLLNWNRTYRFPLALMGSGSNILFSDHEFPGIVISLKGMQRLFWLSDDELFCEAGVDNTLIAEKLFSVGKGGGEWLYRLPGQIGATVRMNARCFGGEVSAITSGILTLSVDGRLRWRLPDEVFLGYKQTSLMGNPEIVVAVVLRFPESPPVEEIRRVMREHEEERTKKHHFDFPSCGSTFKNNYAVGRSSGMIFEELGFKGQSVGGAMVSEYHANFIYNKGAATAADVLTLAARMRTVALEQAGVELDLEVQCIGLFDAELLASCGVGFAADHRDSSQGWAGLLWAPVQQEKSIQEPFFPRTLMRGPLSGYFGLDREFPAGVVVEVEQLCSLEDAAAAPEAPFLRWTTRSNESVLFSLKAPSSGGFTDGLWQYGVSELFIARDPGGGYLEFEMTPEGHWVALRFDAPRKRVKGYEVLSAEPWSREVSLVREAKCFGMEFSLQLLKPLISEGQVIALQCAASSGRGEFGLFPWWQRPSSPADFHQPDQFFRVTLL
ncbi:MAG: UDP-N-acetylmuramate dehydrogenase [Chlorobium sp.]